jgi:DNA-binding protein H-NS
MPKASNLASMSVDALLKLKEDVGDMLSRKTSELRKQLQRLEGRAWAAATGKAPRKPHPRKGKKVPAKYRDTNGNSWAGRGAQPVWLRDALKGGAKLEDFAVSSEGAKRGRKPGRKAA